METMSVSVSPWLYHLPKKKPVSVSVSPWLYHLPKEKPVSVRVSPRLYHLPKKKPVSVRASPWLYHSTKKKPCQSVSVRGSVIPFSFLPMKRNYLAASAPLMLCHTLNTAPGMVARG